MSGVSDVEGGKWAKLGVRFAFSCFWAIWALSSFGKFVFSGLRSNSGIRQQGEVDLYLRGEDGLKHLTAYNCSLCSKTAHYV
jgi:hypothetical protein